MKMLILYDLSTQQNDGNDESDTTIIITRPIIYIIIELLTFPREDDSWH